MSNTDVDEVLNVLGFGRMQLIIFFSCATTSLYVTNEQLGLAIITVAARCDLEIDEHKMAWLMTAVFFAQVTFSHYMGYQSDIIGRPLMPEFWSFLLLRFIVGCFLTGPGMAALTYLSEFTKISLRPKVINFLSYSIGISMIYVPLSAMILLPLDIHIQIWGSYEINSWRVLMMTNLLPGLFACIMFYHLPESPKYYLSVNKPEKALEVLEQCCRFNKGKDVDLLSLGITSVSQPRLRSDATPVVRNCLSNMWHETKPLFQGIHRRYMLTFIAILFLLFATGFGLTVWMPRVLKMAKEIPGPKILCDLVEAASALNITSALKCGLDTENLRDSIFNGCCCLATFMLISLLLLCLNRTIILLSFSLIAACAGFMLNFVTMQFLIIISFIFLTVPPLCSLRLLLTVLIDVIPTHLRSKAVAIAMMFGRVGVLAANMFLGYTLNWNCLVTFNTFVVGMLTSVVLISFLSSISSTKRVA